MEHLCANKDERETRVERSNAGKNCLHEPSDRFRLGPEWRSLNRREIEALEAALNLLAPPLVSIPSRSRDIPFTVERVENGSIRAITQPPNSPKILPANYSRHLSRENFKIVDVKVFNTRLGRSMLLGSLAGKASPKDSEHGMGVAYGGGVVMGVHEYFPSKEKGGQIFSALSSCTHSEMNQKASNRLTVLSFVRTIVTDMQRVCTTLHASCVSRTPFHGMPASSVLHSCLNPL